MSSRPQPDSQARIGTTIPVRTTTTETRRIASKGTGWFWANGWNKDTKETLPSETTSKTTSDSGESQKSTLVEIGTLVLALGVGWNVVAFGGLAAYHAAYRRYPVLRRLVRR
ncbi:hypothetical protein KVR01_009801 [Diaporthe batatas]|uniref:uncharacterized protein n=1 Tax=Diaporthe batatas TaxID=748121 RepID=UPI001D036036|nr:uncharacterized protein KVR01_009801 [Diaporthe batatas]KAG8160265.1 hypothetical protein KVR01_009801 [Diaporthe batatas]